MHRGIVWGSYILFGKSRLGGPARHSRAVNNFGLNARQMSETLDVNKSSGCLEASFRLPLGSNRGRKIVGIRGCRNVGVGFFLPTWRYLPSRGELSPKRYGLVRRIAIPLDGLYPSSKSKAISSSNLNVAGSNGTAVRYSTRSALRLYVNASRRYANG